MPRHRRSRKIGRIPWQKVIQTFTLFPRVNTRGKSALSPEAAIAKDWETVTNDMAVVMGDLAAAWRVTEKDLKDRHARTQHPRAR